jgi:transposase
MEVTTVGMDLAKTVFAVCGADASGRIVLRQQLRRNQVLNFFRRLPPCVVGMEACGGAHWWARQLGELGHTVRLLNPRAVAPYRSGAKNDGNDAAAVCEAASRPQLRTIAVKSIAQQDLLAVHRVRHLLVRQATAFSNQVRALLHERGIAVRPGAKALKQALATLPLDNPDLSGEVGALLLEVGGWWRATQERIQQLEQRLERKCRADERGQRLREMSGVGPITATAALALVGNGSEFHSGRHLSAWLGLVPGQHSSGGKTVLLGITKHGNRYLRTLLIHGARSALRTCTRRSDPHSRWMQQLLKRRGPNVAAVAIANKQARIMWALLRHGDRYLSARAVFGRAPSAGAAVRRVHDQKLLMVKD